MSAIIQNPVSEPHLLNFPQKAPSPMLFFETVNAFRRTEALKSAIELGIFSSLAKDSLSAAEIAKKGNISERGTRILCDYLVVIGFLAKEGNLYRNTVDSAMFLDRKSPAYVGNAIDFLLSPTTREEVGHLTEYVKTGKGGTHNDAFEANNPKWIDFARTMGVLQSMPAQANAKALQLDPAKKHKVLSLAAGHGMFEIAVGKLNPKTDMVAVDWPVVLEVAKENAKAAGVADRYHTIPGDAFKVDFGKDYDVALVTGFLHHFDPPTCEELLRKVHAALTPGGKLSIAEFVPNDDRVSPPGPAAFSLNMLAATPGGDSYTFKELESMLKKAGFQSPEMHPLIPEFLSGIMAKKA